MLSGYLKRVTTLHHSWYVDYGTGFTVPEPGFQAVLGGGLFHEKKGVKTSFGIDLLPTLDIRHITCSVAPQVHISRKIAAEYEAGFVAMVQLSNRFIAAGAGLFIRFSGKDAAAD